MGNVILYTVCVNIIRLGLYSQRYDIGIIQFVFICLFVCFFKLRYHIVMTNIIIACSGGRLGGFVKVYIFRWDVFLSY